MRRATETPSFTSCSAATFCGSSPSLTYGALRNADKIDNVAHTKPLCRQSLMLVSFTLLFPVRSNAVRLQLPHPNRIITDAGSTVICEDRSKLPLFRANNGVLAFQKSLRGAVRWTTLSTLRIACYLVSVDVANDFDLGIVQGVFLFNQHDSTRQKGAQRRDTNQESNR